MTAEIEIIKANFPKQPDNGCFKYLASVGLEESVLANCCVKKARVLGLYDRQHINILCDEVEYQNVPVWIHTDIGARAAFLKGVEAATPEDYFKDAALMFPFLGVAETSYSYVLAIEYTEPETKEKLLLGVISILQGVYVNAQCTINYQTDILPYIKKIKDMVALAYKTYHPFLIIESVKNTYIGDEDYVSIYDLGSKTFAEINTYTNGVPALPKIDCTLISKNSILTNINGFLSSSIRVGSADCFKNKTHVSYGDTYSAGGIRDEMFTYTTRDGVFTTITIDSTIPPSQGTDAYGPIHGPVTSWDLYSRYWCEWISTDYSWNIRTSIVNSSAGEFTHSATSNGLISEMTYMDFHVEPIYDPFWGDTFSLYGSGTITNLQDGSWSSRLWKDSFVESEFCKTEFYDVYATIFASVGYTRERSASLSLTAGMEGVDNPPTRYPAGIQITSTGEEYYPIVSVNGAVEQRDGKIFNMDISSIFEEIGQRFVESISYPQDTTTLLSFVSTKLYLVPYDPRTALLEA